MDNFPLGGVPSSQKCQNGSCLCHRRRHLLDHSKLRIPAFLPFLCARRRRSPVAVVSPHLASELAQTLPPRHPAKFVVQLPGALPLVQEPQPKISRQRFEFGIGRCPKPRDQPLHSTRMVPPGGLPQRRLTGLGCRCGHLVHNYDQKWRAKTTLLRKSGVHKMNSRQEKRTGHQMHKKNADARPPQFCFAVGPSAPCLSPRVMCGSPYIGHGQVPK